MIFIILIIFLCLILAIGVRNSGSDGWFFPSKGKVGEVIVSNKLDGLPKDQYRVLNDVLLPTPKGTSQIDHLVVSIYGIFVIETKNYKGWVYGGEHSEYWTQNLYGYKYTLYNPILQNEGHVKALRRVLIDYDPLPVLPIVAFSGKARVRVKTSEAHVVYWNQIRDLISRFDSKRLSWEQVNAICAKIQLVELESNGENRSRHLQDIKNAKEQKDNVVSSGICPRCGAKLQVRSGKYGRFYGCSNYPQCKYTHPI